MDSGVIFPGLQGGSVAFICCYWKRADARAWPGLDLVLGTKFKFKDIVQTISFRHVERT